MPKFGRKSRTRLATCDKNLQKLFNEVVKHFDCSVLVGFRGKDEQNSAYKNGYSKVKWPNGKHNSNPSFAVDVAPYPINWKIGRDSYILEDLLRVVLISWIYHFAGEEIGITTLLWQITNLMISFISRLERI